MLDFSDIIIIIAIIHFTFMLVVQNSKINRTKKLLSEQINNLSNEINKVNESIKIIYHVIVNYKKKEKRHEK